MRKTAVAMCWAVVAFCSACASNSAIQTHAPSSADKARLGSGANGLGGVASRINLALADVCDCQFASGTGIARPELCGHPITVETAAELHASTNGKRIRITSGMLQFFASDDELAFVLAHELSHILLGHAGAFDGISPKQAEIEADRLGIRIISMTAFDTEIAARFPKRLAQAYPGINSPNGTYQLSTTRTAMISSALMEGSGLKLHAKLASGCKL